MFRWTRSSRQRLWGVAMAINKLYLPPPPAGGLQQLQAEVGDRRRRWLERVDGVVRRAVMGGEARMWLCAALGALDVPSSAQQAAFLGLVGADGDQGRNVAERVVRMVCENRPAWAARVIARDDRLLRRFFSGDSKRILQWFGKFSTGGDTDHEWGARALARYTFVHRESCWHELEWNGKHGQAPATVASKPYYFLELDVLGTVDNFLDNVPSFWRSDELWDSMKEGEFLGLGIDFFTSELVAKMLIDNSPETWHLVEDYLAEESFSKLSNCVLHLLSEETLLNFINELVKQLSKAPNQKDHRRKGTDEHRGWLEEIVLAGEKCRALDDAIVCNACANHRRQVLNILRDEEHEEEADALKLLFSEVEDDAKVVWALRYEGLTVNRWVSIKWLALESWFLYAYLSENSQHISFPVLFKENNIGFDALPGTPRKRKKKRSRKSRKRYRDSEDSDDSSADDGEGEPSKDDCWRLSTDNYSFSWRKEDLPEHLSGYAFGEWVKWAVAYW